MLLLIILKKNRMVSRKIPLLEQRKNKGVPQQEVHQSQVIRHHSVSLWACYASLNKGALLCLAYELDTCSDIIQQCRYYIHIRI